MMADAQLCPVCIPFGQHWTREPPVAFMIYGGRKRIAQEGCRASGTGQSYDEGILIKSI
jgi:hypothetical protein